MVPSAATCFPVPSHHRNAAGDVVARSIGAREQGPPCKAPPATVPIPHTAFFSREHVKGWRFDIRRKTGLTARSDMWTTGAFSEQVFACRPHAVLATSKRGPSGHKK